MKRFLILVALVFACSSAFAFDPFNEAGIDQRPGAQVPLDGAFVDEAGKSVTLAELAGGKPMLLVPVLHNCPNICGVTLSGLAQAARAQPFEPGEDFIIVTFGIDPKEGPAEAQASLAELSQAFPEFGGKAHAVTGRAEAIRAVTDALGYRYAWDDRIGQYAHVAATAVLTPDGKLARWLYGLAPEPTDLRLALTEAGEGQVGNWRDQLLLLCYHYDPETGRYGSLVWMLLRVGGGLTVAAGLSFIGSSILRERQAGGRR
ncbi:SCO family protein [Chelativorans sp. AA-79]|uniref:SCO family protein n=1 Tax=Chelativorans sp. AA-79 TaxID=3028735 RepID=UPI0023F92BB8|nr:SCO family protein [Chelativorans sp. AA-79]WEX10569.1 SCO family protein [Chelativorans sp. AA-79]